MILRILGFLFRKRQSPYERGYEYAWAQLIIYGQERVEELEAISRGTFNCSESEHDFDRGIRDAVSEYEKREERITENASKDIHAASASLRIRP